MDELMEILEELRPDVDFEDEKAFADTVQKIISNYDEYTGNIPAFLKDYNISIEKQKFVEALKPLFA